VSGIPTPRPGALLLDIEGTTTPAGFVYQVLFPYARERAARYLRLHADEPAVATIVHQLRADLAAERQRGDYPARAGASDEAGSLESIGAYVAWAMDRDRKLTSLKALQGLIWEEGYRAGDLHGEVFDDVPAALERWHRLGIDVRIYSSGSVLAQRWLFSTVRSGDLARYLRGFFDTGVGAKTDPSSYVRIAASFDRPPPDVLFISDVVAELDAARTAGLSTRLAVRPGNPPQPSRGNHDAIPDFAALGF
jgi:methylthioribulose 1-phosphate dehydratase/enolase-phosphatase E1